MKNVFTFLRSHWRFLIGLFFVLGFVVACISVFNSCSSSAERITTKINESYADSNLAKVHKLLSTVETLEKKDSIINEKIKEIDSLRVELGAVTTDIDELYGFLSKRYNTEKPKR